MCVCAYMWVCWERGITKTLRSKAEEEQYQRSFVACVDKYTKMSSLRDLGGFLMVIIGPLSCNELLQ